MVEACLTEVLVNGGGGVLSIGDCEPVLTNCTISDNSATGYGGGIWSDTGEPVTPTKVTASIPTLDNCIVWGNSDRTNSGENTQVKGDGPVINYSCIQGWSGALGGTGNKGNDPLFINAAGGDYHLSPASLCIDAGNPNYIPSSPNETDLDGNPRIVNGIVDMGAYEAFIDNAAPVACIVGGDRTVEADGFETKVTLDGSCSSDADSTPGSNDDIVYFNWYKADPGGDIFLASGEVIDCNLPLGVHTIILEVTDTANALDVNEVNIIVQDSTQPEFSLSVTPEILWPPNHKMVEITPSWTVSDNCDESPEVTLVNITTNESDNALGDGNTDDDIQIIDGTIYLRAERSGMGNDRVYTITYQAVDDSGNTAQASANVTVPHDRR